MEVPPVAQPAPQPAKKGTESCKIKISEKHALDIKEVKAWYKKVWNIFKLEYNISGENSGKSHGKK